MPDLTIQSFPAGRLVPGMLPPPREDVNSFLPKGFRTMDGLFPITGIIQDLRDRYDYTEEDVVSLIVLEGGGEDGTKIVFKPEGEKTSNKGKMPSNKDEKQFLLFLDEMNVPPNDPNVVRLLRLKVYFRSLSQQPFTITHKVSNRSSVSFHFENNELKKVKADELTNKIELEIRGENGKWDQGRIGAFEVTATNAEAGFFQILIDPEALEKLGLRGKHMQGRFRLAQHPHLDADADASETDSWNEWHETGWFLLPSSPVEAASNSPKKNKGSSSPKGNLPYSDNTIDPNS